MIHVHTTLSFDLKPLKTFKEVVEYAISISGKSRKEIAAGLGGPKGISEGRLSMMLNQYDGKRHFPLAWLPDLIRVLGDAGKIIVHWLVKEFLLSRDERLAQAQDTYQRCADVLPVLLEAMQTIVAEGREK